MAMIENSAAVETLHICALLPEVETALSTLQCAIAAGQGFAAEFCAVHVGFDLKHSFVSAEESALQQLRDIYEGGSDARTARIKAVVDTFLASQLNAPAVHWRNDEGAIDANVALESTKADLLVIGRPTHMDAADALHSVLFHAHRLVLVAPRVARAGRAIGKRMAIGWKPGNSAEQAIAAALPWLRRAERITVLWAAKAGAEPYDASAKAFFAGLGLGVDIRRLERKEKSVGLDLLAEAVRQGDDCLVTGAYRHGALWESIFGGVTHDILKHANMPAFMMRTR
jgi:nucleotide-binding universal stress UspA family protein